MRRIFSWEGLLIALLVGMHLFVFARGMGGNDGWSYLANTVSLVEDQDLDLANNRRTFPEPLLPEYGDPDGDSVSPAPGSMPAAQTPPETGGADAPGEDRPAGPPPGPPPAAARPAGAAAPRPGATPGVPARPPLARPEDRGPAPEPPAGATPPTVPRSLLARPEDRDPASGPPGATPPRARPTAGPPPEGVSESTEQETGPPAVPYDYSPPSPYMESRVHEGRFVTHEPLGTSFFDFPFVFAATKIVGEREFSFGFQHPDYRGLSGKETAQVIAVIISHSFWTLLAVLLLYATMLKLDYTRGDSVMATLMVFFSSSLTWYGPSGFSHPVSVFMTAVVVYAFVSLLTVMQENANRGYYVRILFLGIAAGLAGVVRYPNAIIGGVLFLYLLFERQSWGKRFVRLLVFLVGFAALWSINHYYWYIQFGEFLTPHGLRLLEFNQKSFLAPLRTLFFLNGGFFLFSPLFLFGVFGLLMFMASHHIAPIESRVGRVALLSTLLLATLYGLHGEWAGGGFGNRFLCNCAIFMGLGVIEVVGGEDHRIMRYILALAATTWSYLVFLLAQSRIFGGGYTVPQNIRQYWSIFGRGWFTREVFLKKLFSSSNTVNYLNVPERRAILIAIAIVVGVLLIIAFVGSLRHVGSWRYVKVTKKKGGDPAARWRA